MSSSGRGCEPNERRFRRRPWPRRCATGASRPRHSPASAEREDRERPLAGLVSRSRGRRWLFPRYRSTGSSGRSTASAPPASDHAHHGQLRTRALQRRDVHASAGFASGSSGSRARRQLTPPRGMRSIAGAARAGACRARSRAGDRSSARASGSRPRGGWELHDMAWLSRLRDAIFREAPEIKLCLGGIPRRPLDDDPDDDTFNARIVATARTAAIRDGAGRF